MLEEFKKFALRGIVVDLAVGVIIGVAFGAMQVRQLARAERAASIVFHPR